MSEDTNSLEDSMEEMKFIDEEDSADLEPYQKDFNQVSVMLSQAINLNNENRLHEPTCPICCSKLRDEAEGLWTGRTGKPIVDLFKERSNAKVSAEVVKNHMKYHKDGGDREIKKVEYVERIRKFYGKNVTTLDRIDLCLAVITDRLMQINSLGPSGDKSLADIEKIKSSETNKLMGTYSNLLKIQATIFGEMENNGEIISIPSNIFIQVFNDAFTSARSDNEREIISNIMNGLKG